MAKQKKDRFEDIKARAQTMRDDLSERDTTNARIDKMYNLDIDIGKVDSSVRLLVSPRPHNTIETGARLYATNPPRASVRVNKEDAKIKAAAGRFENWLDGVLHCNNPARLVADVMRSLELYDECSILVLPRYQFEDDYVSPFDFVVLHPCQSFPHYNNMRLTEHLYRAETTWADFVDSYGQAIADKLDKTDGFDDEDCIIINDYATKNTRCIWLDETPDQYSLVEHKLGFMTRASIIATAPSFMPLEKDKRKGLLFALDAARLWESETLLLTAGNTNVAGYLNNNWIGYFKDPSQHKRDELRANATSQLFAYETGENVTPFPKTLIEPEHLQWLGQVSELSQISTFPNIVAGASPFSGITASATTTMSSNGRLIMHPYAAAAKQLLADALTICAKLATKESTKGKVRSYGTSESEIGASDLADLGGKIMIDVTLEPDVSMERQLNMQLAQGINGMGFGLDQSAQVLERGGIIANSEEAVKGALVWKYIEANIKQFSERAAKEAGAADQLPPPAEVPTMPGLPNIGNAAMVPNAPPMAEESGGMPAGVMPTGEGMPQ